MEDIIKEKLCDFCMNKNEKCIIYEKIEEKNMVRHKCRNYKKDETKIKGYTEKWIDTTIISIIKSRKGIKQKMKIVIDMKLQTWNEIINQNRRNKYMANNIKQKEMETITYYLLNVKKIQNYPVKIVCKWHIKNVNSDLDNKSIKAVLDIMQKMGILENDNIKHITGIEYQAIKDNKDYLEMEIIENEQIC